jgi:broad specificity phosphatase PhoE
MGKMILVRHGESEGNRMRHFTASPDVAITDLGREQAREAGRVIRQLFRPHRVISSPYFRARETARIIAEQFRLPVEIEQELREQNLGDLVGKPYEAVRDDPAFDPARSWQWRPRGGESHEDVRARTAPVLDRVARSYESEELVIVSHGGVMRALWAHVTGRWDEAHIPANCGIIVIEHERGVYGAPRIVGPQTQGVREAGG